MRTSRLFAILAILATGLVVAVAGPASAVVKTTSGLATVTQAPTVATPNFNTTCLVAKKYQNCAEIRTQLQVDSYMVLGGSFQQVLDSSGKAVIDPATGTAIALNNLVLLDTSNNNAVVTTFKHTFNGEVLATAVSADHSILYVGGGFTKVDGKMIQHLVAFSLTPGAGFGKILPAFNVGGKSVINPGVKNPAYPKHGGVRALLVGPSVPGGGTAGTLYVGGDFTNGFGGTAQQLIAVDIASGRVLTGFTPNFVASTTLPYCGDFTQLTAATNWTQIWSLALSNDGTTNRLYVSGHFDTVDGNAQTALAAVNPTTGRYDPSFKPSLSYETSAINPSTGLKQACYDKLHTGNQVTPVDGTGGRAPSVLLAQAGHYNCAYRFALDGTRTWVTRPGGDSQSIVIVNQTVYVGGHFICWSTDQAIGIGRSDCLADMKSTTLPKSYDVQRVHLAALDYGTGALDMSWAPLAQPSTYSPYYFGVWNLLVDNQGQLWAGGAFRTVNTPDGSSYSRQKLAVFPVLTSSANPSGSFFPLACKQGTSCTFTGYGDPAPGSTITGYSWNFGDPGSASNTATGQQVSHTYAASGPVTVTLTFTDSKGRMGIATYVVRVVA